MAAFKIIALGEDKTALAAWCEHLPWGSVLVTTPVDLQRQLSGDAAILLVDDSTPLEWLNAIALPILALSTPKNKLFIQYIESLGGKTLTKPVTLTALRQALTESSKSLNNKSNLSLTASCALDSHTHTLLNRANNDTVSLTEKESKILVFLYDNKNQPVERETLHREIWGHQTELSTHTLETHIYRLRAKLKEAAGAELSIQTDKNGYRLSIA